MQFRSILQDLLPKRNSTYTSGALEDALDAPRLLREIVALGRGAGNEVRARQGRGGLEPAGQLVEVEGIDEHSGVRRHELGRAADARRDDRAAARERLEQCLAERLDEARLADDPRARDPAGDLVVRRARDDLDAGPALQARAQRAVADERQLAGPETAERLGEADDVLALGQRAEAEERLLAVGLRLDAKALEVDPRVDHLGLAAGLGNLRLELATQIVGNGDHRGGGGNLSGPGAQASRSDACHRRGCRAPPARARARAPRARPRAARRTRRGRDRPAPDTSAKPAGSSTARQALRKSRAPVDPHS